MGTRKFQLPGNQHGAAVIQALTAPAQINPDGTADAIVSAALFAAASAVHWRLTHSALKVGEYQRGLYKLGNHAQAVALLECDLAAFRSGVGEPDERKEDLQALARYAATLTADELRGPWLATRIGELQPSHCDIDLTTGMPARRAEILADCIRRLSIAYAALEPLKTSSSRADMVATNLFATVEDVVAELIAGFERAFHALPSLLQPYAELPPIDTPWLNRLRAAPAATPTSLELEEMLAG